MKKLLFTAMLILSTIYAYSQAMIGLTQGQIKKAFGTTATYGGYKLQSGDSILVVESLNCDLFCETDYYTHKVTSYVLICNNTSFFRAYVQALNEKHIKISDRKWVTHDYSIFIEYTWLAEYADYGFVINQR